MWTKGPGADVVEDCGPRYQKIQVQIMLVNNEQKCCLIYKKDSISIIIFPKTICPKKLMLLYAVSIIYIILFLKTYGNGGM